VKARSSPNSWRLTAECGPVVLVTTVGAASGARAAAAALACAASEPDRAALLIDLDEGRPPRATLIATAGARALEKRLNTHLPDARIASRG
jgi:Mrp family chromosome partitioning ATPase